GRFWKLHPDQTQDNAPGDFNLPPTGKVQPCRLPGTSPLRLPCPYRLRRDFFAGFRRAPAAARFLTGFFAPACFPLALRCRDLPVSRPTALLFLLRSLFSSS